MQYHIKNGSYRSMLTVDGNARRRGWATVIDMGAFNVVSILTDLGHLP